VITSVLDPYRIGLNTVPDPDPAFEVNADPDPAFEVNTSPDLVPGSFMTNIYKELFVIIHSFHH